MKEAQSSLYNLIMKLGIPLEHRCTSLCEISIVWYLHQKIAIVAGAHAAKRVYQAVG